MDQSSFPKQSRADQDSRSDVDQDLPVDQTRKEDDEASDDSCGRPTLTLKEEVADVDDPFGKNYAAKNERNAQENIMKRINNVKKEGNDVRRRRRKSFKTKKNVARSCGVGDSSNLVNAEMFPQNFGTPSRCAWPTTAGLGSYKEESYKDDSSSLVNEFLKIKTFQLTAGSGSGEGGNNKNVVAATGGNAAAAGVAPN